MLLALAVVGTLSFPMPAKIDAQIPSIPNSNRAQFYILNTDGTYKYGYDTGSGNFEKAKKLESGDVAGFYGYTDVNGEPVRVDYTAGSAGFVPTVVVPEIKLEDNTVALKSALTPDISSGVPGEQINAVLEPRGDASYSFSYDAEESSRSESSDPDLNVKGRFSFIGDDGIQRSIEYTAGSETGFVAKTSETLVPLVKSIQPENPQPVFSSQDQDITSNEPRGDASYSFNYDNGDSSRSETADSDLNINGRYSFTTGDGIQRSVEYKAGSEIGFVATGDHLPLPIETKSSSSHSSALPSTPIEYSAPVAEVVPVNDASSLSIEPASGNSYKFSYQTGSSSRHETSDSDLNVVGRYSFADPDGVERTIDYKAGSETGFIATGDHLPTAPEIANEIDTQITLKSSSNVKKETVQSVAAERNIESPTQTNDASYSFNYETDHATREEKSDSDLNVAGSYSFVADDGVRRTVQYKAGRDLGFVADILPEPVAEPSPVLAVEDVPSAEPEPQVQLKSALPASENLSFNDIELHQYPVGGDRFGYVYKTI